MLWLCHSDKSWADIYETEFVVLFWLDSVCDV